MMKKLMFLLVAVLLLVAASSTYATITWKGADWDVTGSATIDGSGHMILEAPDSTGGTTEAKLRLNPPPSWWRDSVYPATYGQWYEVTFKYDLDDMIHTRFMGSGGLDGQLGILWPSGQAGSRFVIKENGTYTYQGTAGVDDPVDGTTYKLAVQRNIDNTMEYYIDGVKIHDGVGIAYRMNLIDLHTYKRWDATANGGAGGSIGGSIELIDWQWGVGTIPEPATMTLLALGGLGIFARKRRV